MIFPKLRLVTALAVGMSFLIMAETLSAQSQTKPRIRTGTSFHSATNFTLIDSDSDQPISAYDPIREGAVLNFASLPTTNLNIRANSIGPTQSVRFDFDGLEGYSTDDESPYALAGDVSGDYAPWIPSLGDHTVVAIAFSADGATGLPGGIARLNFSVVDEPIEEFLINAGGSSYVDSWGKQWLADNAFQGGSGLFIDEPIQGTTDPLLYQSTRIGNGFSYSFPVRGGIYDITLYFAESFWGNSGDRIFDFHGEGNALAIAIDIVEAVGPLSAYTITASVEVFDSTLDIAFLPQVDRASVSAIEIRGRGDGLVVQPRDHNFGESEIGQEATPLTLSIINSFFQAITVSSMSLTGEGASDFSFDAVTPFVLAPGEFIDVSVGFTPSTVGLRSATLNIQSDAPLSPNLASLRGVGTDHSSEFQPIRINSAGSAYTDQLGQDWIPDTYFIGGSSLSTGNPIANTEDDTLYQTWRSGSFFRYEIPLPEGSYHIRLHFAETFWTSPLKRVFDVVFEGEVLFDDLDIWTEAGGRYVALSKEIEVGVSDGVLNIEFSASIDNANVAAIEIETDDHQGDPFLHIVHNDIDFAIDHDESGSEIVLMDSSESHTHEPDHQLISWIWEEGSTEIGSGEMAPLDLLIGSHALEFTIEDDNLPPRTLSTDTVIEVFPPDQVGGVLARYFPGNGVPLSELIDSLPADAEFTSVHLDGFRLDPNGSLIANSPYAGDVIVSLKGKVQITTPGQYRFLSLGSAAYRVFLNGVQINGSVLMSSTTYEVEYRLAVDASTSLPSALFLGPDGGTATSIPTNHDHTGLPPFINAMPDLGFDFGGETIVIEGLGFYPSSTVSVNWGGVIYTEPELVITPNTITFTSPAGAGVIDVNVESPNGISNVRTFTYDSNAIPIQFNTTVAAGLNNVTQAAWGPDGRLYAVSSIGQLMAITFDDDYNVLATQTINTIANNFNAKTILGIAFNPFDPPSPVRVYVAHATIFFEGGTCFQGSSPYRGRVTRLEGPNFDTPVGVVTGLPSSNHDHEPNGIAFDNQGDLLISMGGQTNAGIVSCEMGDLPESPLSAAMVRAKLSKPGYNGAITYRLSSNGAPETNQKQGGVVDIAPGVDVDVFASGLRNPFDCVFTLSGRLFATDNGPNFNFGERSTGPTTEGPDPESDDEVNLVTQDHYFGHPNRNRGRYEYRENVYRHPTEAREFVNHETALVIIDSSTDGIDEYRASTFRNRLKGALLAQKWNGPLHALTLSPDGRTIIDNTIIENAGGGLDVLAGPGGAIFGVDHTSDIITVGVPNDVSIQGMTPLDIFPWRATADGTYRFVIGGENFGSLADTHVHIDGLEATITSVSATRIHGIFPVTSTPTSGLLDVEVESNGESAVLSDAFRFLLRTGEGTGTWQTQSPLPLPLSHVASAALQGIVLVIGGTNNQTLAYDEAVGLWRSDLAVRPFPGTRHSAESVDGKLYLFGGFGAEGKVQIYDIESDSWSLGTDMPYAGAGVSSAEINGLVYVAGGVVGSSTVDSHAVYDPTLDSWTSLSPMPVGRNTAAFGSDGEKFYVFGGRGQGSGDAGEVALGFDDVMIYDPILDTWESSFDVGSAIPPLPQNRGGMGRAVFFGNEFYVLGGETTPDGSGQVEGDVYDRVDVFNPITLTWRIDAPLLTPRHGIYGVAFDGKIFIPGGGLQAGSGESSSFMEALAR